MFLDKVRKNYVIATPIDFDLIDRIALGLQAAKFDVDWSNAGVELLFDDATVSININKNPPNSVKLAVRYFRGKSKGLLKFAEDLDQVSFADDKDLVKNILTEVTETFERYFS